MEEYDRSDSLPFDYESITRKKNCDHIEIAKAKDTQ